jgi:hypothetical protein
MADTKVSALSAVTTPAVTDEFPVNQGGTSKKMTLAQIWTPNTTSASVEGRLGWDSTAKDLTYYDSQRVRDADMGGWAAYAVPPGFAFNATYTTVTTTLPANGGSLAVPIFVPGPMLVQSMSFYIGASTTPTCEMQLYEQYLNNGNAGENTLAYVSGLGITSASRSASALNTVNFNTPGTYIPGGSYWIVIRNTSASNTLGIGYLAAGTMAQNNGQTKTLGSTIVGASLDFVAATWTKVTWMAGVRLNGRVFGGAAAF